MVHERVVLGRVEHLEQRARRIALERHAQLVHLVEQEDRVLGAGLLHPVDDPARHGADVGAPVAPDVGLVARAAERDPDVLPPHRAGDALGNRGLADARRADEQQDRAAWRPVVVVALDGHVAAAGRWRWPAACRCDSPCGDLLRLPLAPWLLLGGTRSAASCCIAQLAHGQELEHAVLHVAQGVVILVEDPLRLGQLEVLLAAHVPGQLRDVLEERPDDLGLHGLAADPAEPVELAVHFLPGLGRQVERLELLPELLEIVALVALAQLALNGLELLAEEHLPLPLAQLLLHLGLDVLLGIEHADLALHVDQHPAEPLLDAERLEQPLALGRGDVDVPGHQVGEPAGLVDAGQHLLDHFIRQSGLLAQLGRARPRLAMQRRRTPDPRH